MVSRENYQLAQEFLDYLSNYEGCDKRSIQTYRAYLKPMLLWLDEHPLEIAHDVPESFTEYLGQKPRASQTNKKIASISRRLADWYKECYPQKCKKWPKFWSRRLRPPSIEKCTVRGEPESVGYEEIQQIAAFRFDENQLSLWIGQITAIFLYLSGMRVGALATLPICAVDLEKREIQQWVDLGVQFKNWKIAKNQRPTTILWNIPTLLEPLYAWQSYVTVRLPATAMWLPPTVGNWGQRTICGHRPGYSRNSGLAHNLRRLAQETGLPYKTPHAYRHGHVHFGLSHAQSIADYQAISQNVMHADMFVTARHYSNLELSERHARLDHLTGQPPAQPHYDRELLTDMFRLLNLPLPERELSQAELAKIFVKVASQMM